jgi:DNA-binding transcriptional LysR family regulator
MEVTVRGRIAANNLGLMRLLAERGLGIAVLSHVLARDAVNAGRLVQVLQGWTLPPLPGKRVVITPPGTRAVPQMMTAGRQRCGSSSSIRPAGCVGSLVNTSLR